MRFFGARILTAALAIGSALSALPPSVAQAQSTGTLVPGQYRSNWGTARVIRGPGTEQARIEFDDGSLISGQFVGGPNGRFIGTFIRARGAGGRTPGRMTWMSPCGQRAPAIPVGFADPETRYWGTIRLTFGDTGWIVGGLVACQTLPHNIGGERQVFRADLIQADDGTPSRLRQAPLRPLGIGGTG